MEWWEAPEGYVPPIVGHWEDNGEAFGAARWCNDHGRTWHVHTWTNSEWGIDEVLGCGCQRYMATPCANGHLRVAGKIEYEWQDDKNEYLWRWPCGCTE